ncbi:MAG: AAA family ATPase, partial [Planctomycetota bacterium]|nr:AAA family ATPase [Planctomycetota bacterium]
MTASTTPASNGSAPGPAIDLVRRLADNVKQVFVGREATVELLLTALLAEGHLLIEDAPGVGKTTLAKALARSIDASFKRIQFTPDLLPSDIVGVSVF